LRFVWTNFELAWTSSARSPFATLEQPGRFHPLRPRRERRRRTAPAQGLHTLKERRIGPQRREILEEQREIALFAENVLAQILAHTDAPDLRFRFQPNDSNTKLRLVTSCPGIYNFKPAQEKGRGN
jgi:hypothetical protein